MRRRGQAVVVALLGAAVAGGVGVAKDIWIGDDLVLDSDSAVIVVYEDSSSTTYPTMDYAVRNETFSFIIHMRVLHRRDFADNTTSRDRLRILYRILRHVLETNSLSPTISTTVGGTVYTDSAEIIKLQSRSEANDRNKRLLGYKLLVEMRRYGRS